MSVHPEKASSTTGDVEAPNLERKSSALRIVHDKMDRVLALVPNTVCGIGVGLAGNASMWKTARTMKGMDYDLARALNYMFWVMAATIITILVCLLVCKAAICPGLVLAEWRHPVRAHFWNMPHIVLILLGIAMPPAFVTHHAQRVIWVFGATMQTGCSVMIYGRWLFDRDGSLGHDHAVPPFLLSTVGWILLTLLAQSSQIDAAWGIDMGALTFGMGIFMYAVVVFTLFQSMGEPAKRGQKGSPALFLMLAPSSLSALCLRGFDNNHFDTAATCILGFVIILFLVRTEPGLLPLTTRARARGASATPP